MTIRVVTLLWVLANAFANASSADDGGESKYRAAFYANALATLDRMMPADSARSADESASNEAKTAQILTDCHMRVVGVYSAQLQQAAFTAIRNGGTYLQAKEAFNAAVATESAAGGEREEAVRQMFEKAMLVGQECLKQLPEDDR